METIQTQQPDISSQRVKQFSKKENLFHVLLNWLAINAITGNLLFSEFSALCFFSLLVDDIYIHRGKCSSLTSLALVPLEIVSLGNDWPTEETI